MTATQEALLSVATPGPEVELIHWFDAPLDNSVGAARTCYSSRIVYPQEVSKDVRSVNLRDSIARSTYEAGHHTTIQHPTFQFVIRNVSRQLLWSFLHAHPFYNSEQVSQRYVEVKRGNYVVPPLGPDEMEIYQGCAAQQIAAYRALIEELTPEITERYYGIFPARRRKHDQYERAIRKRAYEVARYVLPVATYAHLYHTISALTLFRYYRICEAFDVPYEQKQLVSSMVAAVRRLDAEFLFTLEDPLPLEDTLEYQALVRVGKQHIGSASSFVESFDASLGERCSLLVDWKVRAETTMAESVRSVLGVSPTDLPDTEAIAMIMDPTRNPYLGSRLNLTTHAKLTRVMHHAHYTFRKKISHTADSQDQRHRMTPGSRPILAAHYQPGRPDYIEPPLVKAVAGAHQVFRRSMRATWHAIDELLDRGVAPEFALYLLPNAFPIRFEESGDLLNLHHKWTLRLCYLAQEEIWQASKDEVEQVAHVHPRIAKHLVAPCGLRKAAGMRPFCPEGSRFCGVPVWNHEAAESYERTL